MIEIFTRSLKRQVISLENLCCGGPCDQIGGGNFATHEEIYGTSACRGRETYAEKLFALSFTWKIEKYLSLCRNFEYVAGKKDGLGLQNPATSAAEKYTSLLRARYYMIGAVMGDREISTADHLWSVKEERRDGKKYWDEVNDAKIRGIVNDQGNFEKRLFLYAHHTGSWLSVWSTIVNGIVPTTTEFCGFNVHVITLTPPPNLQRK